jgi:lysophospholipase L1-like esterase
LIEDCSFTSTRLLHDFDRIVAQATASNAPRTLLFTIFLGANDACLIGERELVPLPAFEANIRKFVETILVQDAMVDTKIVLITPPPINIPCPDVKGKDKGEVRDANQAKRELRGYKTYMSKKRYAERIIQIAREYEETGRVIGLDFWGDLVRARLQDFGEEYEENKLPGSGLYGARDFGEGYFTDGLHLDKRGYNVLSRGLYNAVLSKWPELSPAQL